MRRDEVLSLGWFLMVVGLALICADFIISKPGPQKKPPVPKVEPSVPKIAGPSQWGEIKQDGRKLAITGHPHWSASGEVRPDGSIELQWVTIPDGRLAVSLYKIDARGGIYGRWQWSEEFGKVREDGTVVGLEMSDTLRYAAE